ncbi:hypothetical protein [Sphingomonas sp.]|uniref:hypothetical protein n=1 Tax=Sphingomonas sp. TaxID=28214 RepID=UPI003B00BD71
MRVAFAALGLVVAAPAIAAPAEHHRPTPEQAVAALGDPTVQELAARSLTQLVGIVLDTHVGPAAALTDPRDRVRATDTLGDLVRRDDPRFDDHLYQGTRRTMGTAAAVAGGAARQARELKRTADRLDAALAPVIAALGAGGDRDGSDY